MNYLFFLNKSFIGNMNFDLNSGGT